MFRHPREFLSDQGHGRFGGEFPIRFDFPDTKEDGILSMQIHPCNENIKKKFGLHYSQDELLQKYRSILFPEIIIFIASITN